MIKHYLRIALRNFWKHKVQNLIGIIGLAIGISFFAIGYNWLEYETSYDNFHPGSENIYRIYGIDKQTEKRQDYLPLVLADKLQQEFPEVENIAMFYNNWGAPVKWGEKALGYPDFQFVDEHFFELFTPKIIAGKSDRLLYEPTDLVITEDFAKKYWPTPQEAIGTVIDGGSGNPLTIVAVMENPPLNSNLQAEGYRPDIYDRRDKNKRAADKAWFVMDNQIYVRLHQKADVNAFKSKLQDYLIDKKFNENLILKATHITDMRHTLGSELSFNINYIKTFVGAGLLLLLCAVFNFLNLYVNRILQRIREFKLRKAVGAQNKTIIRQLQIELICHLIIIFVIGLCLLLYITPFFEQRFETEILVSKLIPEYILFSFTVFVLIFFICFFAESRIIRFTSLSQSFKGSNYKSFRNASIALQLVICIFFLMSAFVFYRQVSFMGNFEWGFKKEGLIQLNMDASDREGITKEINNLPIVKEFIATGLFSIQKKPYFRQGQVGWEGKPDDLKHSVQIFEVGPNFIAGFQIPLIEGRTFGDEDVVSETNSWGTFYSSNKIIITESLVALSGGTIKIGSIIKVPNHSIGRDGTYHTSDSEVVGIIKDFHTASLQNPVYPTILRHMTDKWNGYNNYVRVEEGREKEAIATMTEIFKKHYVNGDPEEHKIERLSTSLDNLNKSEHASLQLFSVLAVLCILIAIFGIYSISSSNIDRRRREIAIRKVSGATTEDIIRMFLSEYSKLLIAANVIALPVAFYFMHNWLTQYVYRISIEFWMFVLVFAFTLTIVILTVLSQVIRAARKNPAEVMKTE
ncbi:MAG: ABC transporter permease [Prevotella sp.]|jgi:ABC-type antimicrobial peptide transport system permease subunit|nr:ABC transporter permease [Prevotella sp.]